MSIIWYHNKRFPIEISDSIQENLTEKPSIIVLFTRIVNTTNNNNNQFNSKLFLNSESKDALNFSDFIKQIQVSLIDLENQLEYGYIKGITEFFIENLQELRMNNRPVHCTDKKGKTLYITQNNDCDKEGSQDILRKGIQEVTKRTF